jgi:hypothetical protein
MKPYTTEVEFLRDEVEKCHVSMHSQIETINLLMKKNIALKEQKREWVGLTDDEIALIVGECASSHRHDDVNFAREIETKLREKNT